MIHNLYRCYLLNEQCVLFVHYIHCTFISGILYTVAWKLNMLYSIHNTYLVHSILFIIPSLKRVHYIPYTFHTLYNTYCILYIASRAYYIPSKIYRTEQILNIKLKPCTSFTFYIILYTYFRILYITCLVRYIHSTFISGILHTVSCTLHIHQYILNIPYLLLYLSWNMFITYHIHFTSCTVYCTFQAVLHSNQVK